MPFGSSFREIPTWLPQDHVNHHKGGRTCFRLGPSISFICPSIDCVSSFGRNQLRVSSLTSRRLHAGAPQDWLHGLRDRSWCFWFWRLSLHVYGVYCKGPRHMENVGCLRMKFGRGSANRLSPARRTGRAVTSLCTSLSHANHLMTLISSSSINLINDIRKRMSGFEEIPTVWGDACQKPGGNRNPGA